MTATATTPRSLRTDLARASLVTTLLALLLSGGSLLVYELVAYRAALIQDARAQADLIAQASSAALVFDDRKVARDSLAILRLKPAIRAAAILKPSGEVFASFAADTLPGEVAWRRDLELEATGVRFAGTQLDVAYPIRHDGERVGIVYLRAQHELRERAAAYASILALVTLVSLAVAFVVFDRLQRRVTRPLAQVTDVAEAVVSRRDWTLRVPPTDSVDVGVVVRAFNALLSEVEARTGELEQSNERLATSNRQLAQETVERQHAEEELKRLDRRKDEFIATLAHELRNPLAPMMNASALLRAPAAAPEVRARAASIIDRQLRYMARLIDDLLDVSRIMTGKLSLNRELVDLVAVVRGAVELIEPTVAQRRQHLVLHVPPHPCRMVGDAARLNQVFSNLLNNAARYTPAEGRIEVTVTVSAADGMATVAVRDNGIGIEPAMQARIFELFEQADKSLERGSAGLGIGLTLSRQLAQLHGGDVTVASEGLGRGACFTVRLPLGEAAGTPTPAPEAPPPASRRLDVLIADDNVDYAQSLAVVLEAHGHRVRVVHEGMAALSAVAQDLPDLVLLDIGMPGLNGYDVARRLRAVVDGEALRLIAVTGWGQPADRETARLAGFDAHLVKPVPVEELLATVDRVTRG